MRQISWSNIVTPHMSASRSVGGLKLSAEVGWVGALKSSGIAPLGAGSSVMGRIGSPVARFEHIDIALLGGGDQRGQRLAVRAGQVDQDGLRGHVHVPQVVVDELLHPAVRARVDVERDDARRILFDIGRARPCRAGRASDCPSGCRPGPAPHRPRRPTSCWASWWCRSRPLRRRSARWRSGLPLSQFHSSAPVSMSRRG